MVGLGDCLKMFSGEQTKPSKFTGTPDATTSTKVMIAAPTSPRLKFFLKECLSISKWAVSQFFFKNSTYTAFNDFVRRHLQVGKLRVTFLGKVSKKPG
jgi:hypothetical protein